jgi:hypothetical protein
MPIALSFALVRKLSTTQKTSFNTMHSVITSRDTAIGYHFIARACLTRSRIRLRLISSTLGTAIRDSTVTLLPISEISSCIYDRPWNPDARTRDVDSCESRNVQSDITDPPRFLHAPHSREALRVSHSMFVFLFSYHQVIPSFLDFLFPFGKQIYARDAHFSGLREDSRFDKRSSPNDTGLSGLGRSGADLRLCYNLRSVERSATGQPGLQWSIRQAAVYHEFDIETGRALWIFVKGNKMIKQRMEEFSTLSSSTKLSTHSEAFAASLAPHLLLCDWAGENWRWYINDLEEELQKLTRDVLAAQVDRPPSPTRAPLVPGPSMSSTSRTSSFPMFSRSGTDQFSGKDYVATNTFHARAESGFSAPTPLSRAPTLTSKSYPSNDFFSKRNGNFMPRIVDAQEATSMPFHRIVDEFKERRSRLWTGQSAKPADLSSATELQSAPCSSKGVAFPKDTPPLCCPGQEQRLTFKDLQRIQDIEEKTHEACQFLKSNMEILIELKQYYAYATNHTSFPTEVRTVCRGDLARFDRCVLSVEKDLRMLQSRTDTLIRLLENRKSLVSYSDNPR